MLKIAYILAASHSGSTLLAMLLGAHPKVCTVGELNINGMGDPHTYRCSCGEPILRCQFWNTVTENMKKKGINFEMDSARTSFYDTKNGYILKLLKPMCRGKGIELIRDVALSFSHSWHTHLRSVQERNRDLIEIILRITGAQIIVDSSKIGLRLKYLLRNKEFDVRVIRLIRDGRGVALTYTDPLNFADASNPTFRAGGFGGDRKGEELTLKRAAYEWRRANEEAENILNGLDKSKWTEVKYERLCAETIPTMKAIFSLLDLPTDGYGTNFRSLKQHVIGNGMRLDNTTEICLDERWKSHFTPHDLHIFDSVAGSMNRKYGYE